MRANSARAGSGASRAARVSAWRSESPARERRGDLLGDPGQLLLDPDEVAPVRRSDERHRGRRPPPLPPPAPPTAAAAPRSPGPPRPGRPPPRAPRTRRARRAVRPGRAGPRGAGPPVAGRSAPAACPGPDREDAIVHPPRRGRRRSRRTPRTAPRRRRRSSRSSRPPHLRRRPRARASTPPRPGTTRTPPARPGRVLQRTRLVRTGPSVDAPTAAISTTRRAPSGVPGLVHHHVQGARHLIGHGAVWEVEVPHQGQRLHPPDRVAGRRGVQRRAASPRARWSSRSACRAPRRRGPRRRRSGRDASAARCARAPGSAPRPRPRGTAGGSPGGPRAEARSAARPRPRS